ncbi:conserved exported hypothetical protein [Gammaproteobacteria bacterium]
MNIQLRKPNLLALSVLGSALLTTGCVTAPTSLYQWEGYQPQIYEYFKGQGKGPEAQISTLEEGLQKIRATGRMPPPGYHAHLGLLYSQIGKEDQVVQEFHTEQELYPEAAAYMNFLLSKKIAK